MSLVMFPDEPVAFACDVLMAVCIAGPLLLLQGCTNSIRGRKLGRYMAKTTKNGWENLSHNSYTSICGLKFATLLIFPTSSALPVVWINES